jgi:hypothetical protein
MVADAYDAVSAVEEVTRADIVLDDHHASTEINDGVAAHAGLIATFAGEADAELEALRRYFLEKAVLAGQDRVARPMVHAGVGPDELAELTLVAAPASPDLDRLRQRRAALGLPAGDDAALLIHGDGSPLPEARLIAVAEHPVRWVLRRAGAEEHVRRFDEVLHDPCGRLDVVDQRAGLSAVEDGVFEVTLEPLEGHENAVPR